MAGCGGAPLWRTKSEYISLAPVPIRSCRVTIRDLDGVSHTVEVMAASLFEAVARGVAALQGSEWVPGIGQGQGVVKVQTEISMNQQDHREFLALRLREGRW